MRYSVLMYGEDLGKRPRRAIPAILVSVLAVATACSFTVDADRQQCAKDSDCASHGLGAKAVCLSGVCAASALAVVDAGLGVDGPVVAEDPIWGCLGKVPPPPPEEPTVPVPFYFTFSGAISQAPLADMPIRACPQLDLECAQPFGPTARTDANGLLQIPLHSGFRGYLETSAPPAVPDLYPALLYVLPVPDKNVPAVLSAESMVSLPTKNEFVFIAASAQKAIKEGYGHLIFAALDCQSHLVENAMVRADQITPDTFIYFTDEVGTPSLTQEKTSKSGNGGILNLPVGPQTVTMTLDTGRRTGSHEIVIRSGAITFLLFRPTP